MAQTMADRAPEEVRRSDLVTAIPTTRSRRRKRGYNQAEILGRALAAELRLPYVETMERPGRSSSQIVLKPLERRANVMDAFVLKGTGQGGISGRRIVLVDDVMTTGSTAISAATTLAAESPLSIVLYVFARAIPLHH